MKKLLAKAGISTLTAALLLSGASMVFGNNEVVQNSEKSATVTEREVEWDFEAETVFWKKKDKSAAPKEENPDNAPIKQQNAPKESQKDSQKESPSESNKEVDKDSPQETQKQSAPAAPDANTAPNTKTAPVPAPTPATPPTPAKPRDNAPPQIQQKPDEGAKPGETSDASFVYNSNSQNRVNQPQGQQNQQNQQGQPAQQNQQNLPNQQYQQPAQQNRNQQPAQQNRNQQQAQPIQQNQQNPQSRQGQQSAPQSRHACTNYASGISCEINKILANQPAIQLDPNAYMLQHDDGLWLIMGNIRAKVEILIYVDEKHMENSGFEGGNAIPLYK